MPAQDVARSRRNPVPNVFDTRADLRLDVFALADTWLGDSMHPAETLTLALSDMR